MWKKQLISSIYILSLLQWVISVELTFDLPDSSHECFHQDIEKNRSATLEFQVKYCGPHSIGQYSYWPSKRWKIDENSVVVVGHFF